MLKFSLIHLIATDMHGLNKRPPILSEAQEKAAKIIGRQDSLDMVTTTPLNIIEDKELNLPKPKRP
jgi:protein-tyrosine phosphatase